MTHRTTLFAIAALSVFVPPLPAGAVAPQQDACWVATVQGIGEITGGVELDENGNVVRTYELYRCDAPIPFSCKTQLEVIDSGGPTPEDLSCFKTYACHCRVVRGEVPWFPDPIQLPPRR